MFSLHVGSLDVYSFFFLIIRPPPRSTLFPYTTLFTISTNSASFRRIAWNEMPWSARMKRSEEHTSELQSHSDLVCHLLLEKKKNWEATIFGYVLRILGQIKFENQSENVCTHARISMHIQ